MLMLLRLLQEKSTFTEAADNQFKVATAKTVDRSPESLESRPCLSSDLRRKEDLETTMHGQVRRNLPVLQVSWSIKKTYSRDLLIHPNPSPSGQTNHCHQRGFVKSGAHRGHKVSK